MTSHTPDKAAREAFEKWMHVIGMVPDSQDALSAWNGWCNGYQAAHDAAMAEVPDVQKAFEVYGRGRADDCGRVLKLLEAVTLQLQAAQQRERTLSEALTRANRAVDTIATERDAAQQREAECRKDAGRYALLRANLGCPWFYVQECRDAGAGIIRENDGCLSGDELDATVDAALAKGETT